MASGWTSARGGDRESIALYWAVYWSIAAGPLPQRLERSGDVVGVFAADLARQQHVAGEALAQDEVAPLATLTGAVQVQHEGLAAAALAEACSGRLVELFQAGQPQAGEVGDAARRDRHALGGQFHADLLVLQQFHVAQTYDFGHGVGAERQAPGRDGRQLAGVQATGRGAGAPDQLPYCTGRCFFLTSPRARTASDLAGCDCGGQVAGYGCGRSSPAGRVPPLGIWPVSQYRLRRLRFLNIPMRPRALYLVGTYPNWSETFVRQDLRLLLDAGAPLLPVALYRGDTDTASGDDGPSVVYLSPVHGTSRSSAQTGLGRLLRRLCPARWRTALALARHRRLLDAILALARGQGVRHVHGEFADLPGLLAAAAGRRPGMSASISAHARDVHVCAFDPQFLFGGMRFITVCNASARDRLLATVSGIDARVHLIRHGLILADWPFHGLLPRDPSRFRLLFVGRFVAKKGLGVLFAALALARRAGLQLGLTLVGAGPLGPALRHDAVAAGVEDCLSWAGVIPRQRVREFLTAADGLVVPSIVAPDGDQDGIPNVIVEAMAVGTPVLATATGGIPEVVTADTGWCCQPGSAEALLAAVEEIRRSPALAAAKAGRARAMVETQFDALALARERVALFNAACADGGRVGG